MDEKTEAYDLYQKIGALLIDMPEKGTSENYDQAIYGLVMAMDALVREDYPDFEGTSFPVTVVKNDRLGIETVTRNRDAALLSLNYLYGYDAEVLRGWVVYDKDYDFDEEDEEDETDLSLAEMYERGGAIYGCECGCGGDFLMSLDEETSVDG